MSQSRKGSMFEAVTPQVGRANLPRESGIYLIHNTKTELFYIGQSVNISQRWRSHKHLLRRGTTGNNAFLLAAANKYGIDSFECSVLELCPVDRLTERESHWLMEYRDIRGLRVANFAGPVDSPRRGIKASPALRERLALRPPSDPTALIAWNRANKGTPRSAETRTKISKNNAMKKQEHRDKISRAAKRGDEHPMRANPDLAARAAIKRSVHIVDVSTGRIWRGLANCAEEHGVSPQALCAHLKKGWGTCAGKVFSYLTKQQSSLDGVAK